MQGAGDYDTPFKWMKGIRTGTSVGSMPKSWTDGGVVWGSVARLGADRRSEEFGAPRNVVDAQIRLREFLPVTVDDKLVDLEFDETFLVRGVRVDAAEGETVVDAESKSGVS